MLFSFMFPFSLGVGGGQLLNKTNSGIKLEVRIREKFFWL